MNRLPFLPCCGAPFVPMAPRSTARIAAHTLRCPVRLSRSTVPTQEVQS